MRIYLPSTLPALAAVLSAGHIGTEDGDPLRAYAATGALRDALGDDDEEALEYEAMRAAADASLRRLADDPAAPRRRVVLAADVPDALVSPLDAADDPAAVTLSGTVPLKRVASGHVDEEEAAGGAADPDGRELLWYATQELKYLVE